MALSGISAHQPCADCPASVLVVEDDPAITAQLVRDLSLAGYPVSSVATGREVVGRPAVDEVLPDLRLPDIDGVELCGRLCAGAAGAIIVITTRGEESGRVLALDQGADDYLVKPFGRAKLLARVRAVLRRSRPPGGEALRHGDLAVDLRTGKVAVAGREVALTPKEFSIVECLASEPR